MRKSTCDVYDNDNLLIYNTEPSSQGKQLVGEDPMVESGARCHRVQSTDLSCHEGDRR